MPRLRPTGGIFWRLNNGNLTGYDASGNIVAVFIGGLFSTKKNFVSSRITTNNYTQTSSSILSAGDAITFTTQVSTNVRFSSHVFLSPGNPAPVTPTIYIYVDPNGAPSAGNAVTGTQLASYQVNPTPLASAFFNVEFNFIDTSRTVGQAATYYHAFQSDGTHSLGYSGNPSAIVSCEEV